MIEKGNKVRFTMPKDVYDMTKDRNPNVKQVSEGVAESAEYELNQVMLVDVTLDGKLTTVKAQDLEVIE